MKGSNIAGGNPARGRVENDFYATHPDSTKALLRVFEIQYPALEPSCGTGHIAKLLDESRLSCSDIVNRGYRNQSQTVDFPTSNFRNFETVITNPPFNLFTEFIAKALEVSNRYVVFFGKLTALEGKKRASYIQTTPLKYVYVFKSRQQPLRNGSEVDPLTGKKWASSTMAFAWYIWDKEYGGEPIVRWL